MTNIQIIDGEGIDYNGSSDCKFCKKTIYWNNSCINKSTKKKVPLQEPYIPATGILPKAHECWRQNYNKPVDPDREKYRDIGSDYDKSILLDSDSRMLREAKMKLQDKLVGRDASGYTYAERELMKNEIARQRAVQMYKLWGDQDFNLVKKKWKISK